MLKKLPLGKIAATLIVLSCLIRWAFYGSQLITLDVQFAPYVNDENATVFAAYSADGTVPDYVVDYVKKLKQISPNIIYITDNPIKRQEARKLEPYVTHLMAYRHGEYDFGSYKRGLFLLQKHGRFNKLILANDSTFPLAESFAPLLQDMSAKKADVYGITANISPAWHIQSYFLIFTPQVWQHPAFANFLGSVKPETDSAHVIYKYEVPFTQYLIDLGFKADTYLAEENLKHLSWYNKTCYPLTLITQYNVPLLKIRTFTGGLHIDEPRRLVFSWLKKHNPHAYKLIIKHLKHVNAKYLSENR